MKKQWLLLVTVFSCCVTPIIAEDFINVPKDPFAKLRSDLRDRRRHSDNALYADKMVEGATAIAAVHDQKMKDLEKERQIKRRQISSATWYLFWSRPERDSWFYPETPDTIVYKEDKALNEASDEEKQYYTGLADQYKIFAQNLRGQSSDMVKSNLESQYYYFDTMLKAFDKCKNDRECYSKQFADSDLSYEKIISPVHRKKHRKEAFKMGLMVAHSQDIPVTRKEYRKIMEENPLIVAKYNEIKAIDILINDQTDPEKVKEREAKKLQELEAQRIEKEAEEKERLKNELIDKFGEPE